MIKIAIKKKEGIYCQIFLNDDVYREVPYSFYKKKLAIPKIFPSIEQAKTYLNELDYQIGREYACFLLSKKAYLTVALRKKLNEKKFFNTTIDQIEQEFLKLGYLNDLNLLTMLIEKESKKKGKRATFYKLKSLGLDSKFFGPLLEKLYSNEDQVKVIRQIIDKKKSQTPQALYLTLARKGFDHDLIVQGIKEFKEIE